MRKLLPYEHQLIESLGITKEEYLEFVAVQQDYRDPKTGTALDVRNEAGTVALVLTIIGILFQVGAALLAPKPEAPDARRRNRQQRFSPTFGFNSTQDLAIYGDPVNLVYTNENPFGDVRVKGSLVWSAVDSFGSSQLMRLLIVLGAGEIRGISYGKTAFGQAGLADLDQQDVFIFEDDHSTADPVGPPPFNSIKERFGSKEFFPKVLKPFDETKPAFQVNTPAGLKAGYSQAYTPSTSTSLGVFDVIPINVDVQSRDKDGDRIKSNIDITLPAGKFDNNKWRNASSSGAEFKENDVIEILFEHSKHKPNSKSHKEPRASAAEMRRQMTESLDFGSTYMLGTAKFRLFEYSNSNRVISDDNEVKARFKCVKPGTVPGTPYDEREPVFEIEGLREKYVTAKRILGAKNDDFSSTSFSASNMVTGFTYQITEINPAVDFTEAGADENTRRQVFVSTGPLSDITTTTNRGSLLAESSGTVNNGSLLEVDLRQAPYVDIKFTGTSSVRWQATYEASASNNFDVENYNEDTFTNVVVGEFSAQIQRKGSIEYTKYLREQNSAEKPTWKGRALRRILRKQKKRLKDLQERVRSGIFDGGKKEDGANPEDIFQCTNDYVNGFDNGDGKFVTASVLALSETDANFYLRRPQDRSQIAFKTHPGVGGGVFDSNDIVGTHAGQKFYFYTFLYVDAQGTYNLFNFSGSNFSNGVDRDEFEYVPEIRTRRRKLQNAQKQLTKKIKRDDPEEKIEEQQRKVDNRSKRLERKIRRLTNQKHEQAIAVIQKDIEVLDRLLDDVPQGDEIITDQNGTKAIRQGYNALIDEKEYALGVIKQALDDWDGFTERFDNNFFTKCLVKSQTAAYSTVSDCDVVNFSIKAGLLRRISGRQKEYGENKMRKYRLSDNGVKSRIVFFRMVYQKYLPDDSFGEEIIVPYVFAIERGNESDFYTQIGFHSSTKSKWKFRFIPVYDILAEARHRSFTKYFFLENSDNKQTRKIGDETIFWYGQEINPSVSRSFYPDLEENGPIYTNAWDMFSVNSDTQTQFSFESGPELQLTAVTEQQTAPDSKNKYQNMSMMGVAVFANRGLQDLRSISALVRKGKLCRTAENPDAVPTNSSSYAPDIFVDTLLDKDNGLGKYITSANLDTVSLVEAKNFCKNNNLPVESGEKIQLFMDGLIADAGSWREFWISNAPFSLLELARKNGKDTLVPTFPVNNAGSAADDSGVPVEVEVSALFTTGNIIEGSYKEEFLNYGSATEDLIASVIYRDYQQREMFSQQRSVNVQLKDASSKAIRETFDLSAFVSQREQAIMFGKLLCNQRRYIKKGIEFQTFPSEASIEPGSFIYVDVGLKDWDQYSSGVVMAGGKLNAPLKQNLPAGTYNFLLYDTTNKNVVSQSAAVTNANGENQAPALAASEGYMFVMGQQKPRKRVYRVTEIVLEEEGMVSIKAIEYPCFEHGGKLRARIADLRNNGTFLIS